MTRRQGSDPKNIDIVVPAFREVATIRQSLDRMIRIFEEEWNDSFRIIVVTDGSDDGTPQQVRLVQSDSVTLIECVANRGKGAALRVGMQASDAALVAQLDSDLDLHPESLVTLVSILKSQKFDAVVGSKRHPDSMVSYPTFRKILSTGYLRLVGLLFGLDVSDTQTGAKVFVGRALRQVLPRVSEKGFVFDLDLLNELHRNGFVIGEGPVKLDYQFGSSVGLKTVFTMLWGTFRVWRSR